MMFMEDPLMRYIVPVLVLITAAAAAVPSAPEGGRQDGLTEAERIEWRLGRIEARVLSEDVELRRMDEALGAELLAVMEEARPGVSDDARRLAALRGRDGALAEDAAETARLEARVDAARRAALRQHRIASMVDAFHRLLRDRMIRADPEAGRLLERYAELHGGSGPGKP
jgi:hypothetical protein